jgi:surface carbohydrate biosynthesis protein (TIGR04326 family)
MTMNSTDSILIWDSEAEIPKTEKMTVLWKQYVDVNSQQNVVSLPEYIEKNSERLRNQFLEFVYDIGHSNINGTSIQDHLRIRETFSYWWMTLFASTRWHQSSHITEAIKLLALEELLNGQSWNGLVLESESQHLKDILAEFCTGQKKSFQMDSQSPPRKRQVKFAVELISLSVKAHLVLVRQIVRLWKVAPLRKGRNSSQVMIFDHLIRFDTEKAAHGEFASEYWNLLKPMFSKNNVEVSWTHQFVKSEKFPNQRDAQALLTKLNKDSSNKHYLFETKPSIKSVLRAAMDYRRLCISGFRIRKISSGFTPKSSSLNLWPLFQKEWNDSLFGTTAIRHCLILSTIEQEISSQSYCPLGIYIMEYQPWEIALIQAWNAAGHGKLIGVASAPIRFWDLRYFSDARSITPVGLETKINVQFRPVPQFFAVNSPISRKLLETAGEPTSRITDVEALMYQYLGVHQKDDLAVSSGILVLGDFFPEMTERILTMVQSWIESSKSEQNIFFKPHPANHHAVPNELITGLNLTALPLSELFKLCSIVIAPSSSTGSLEAMSLEKHTISILDPTLLNFKPLSSMPDDLFVRNSYELQRAMNLAADTNRNVAQQILHLDPSLPNWKSLLGLQDK